MEKRPFNILVMKVLASFLIFVLWAILPLQPAIAADIEQARLKNGLYIWSIKVEGDITQGDTDKLRQKLLDYYAIAGPTVRTIFLRSQGGDVEEAIKMGTLIRQLRLTTNVPDGVSGNDWIRVSDSKNEVCASACFLVFAGGVHRGGSLLALHRPYISRDAAKKISDLEHEQIEKTGMRKVEEYLKNMEVDRFFIDKMLSMSSQDAYPVSVADAVDHRLAGYPPSIEEILLSKCQTISSQEKNTLDAMADEQESTTERQMLRQLLVEKFVAGDECEERSLTDIRKEAFAREINDAPLADAVKRQADDVMILLLQKSAKVEGQKISSVTELYPHIGRDITTAGYEELRNIFLESHEFPANVEPIRMLQMLAEGGNRGAARMLGETYLFGEPVGAGQILSDEKVTPDPTEAAKWNRKAAEAGDHMSQLYLASAYQSGRGVLQDNVMAYYWFCLAVDYPRPTDDSRSAYDGVIKMRDDLVKNMTAKQIADAQKMLQSKKDK